MENFKEMILRCMVKDLRDGELSSPMNFQYREFIEALIDENFEEMKEQINVNGRGIFTKEEFDNLTPRSFMDAFFS